MMETTLIILIGNPRGNDIVWKSMWDNLASPYDADIALCFEQQEDKSSSLYQKANYIWEVPKYDDWSEYYVLNNIDKKWKEVFDWANKDGNCISFSGVGTAKGKGSGAALIAFRHYLLKNHLETLLKYDRIILTRSDYFYLFPSPILDNNFYWIPKGESYGGITDRFQQFPSKYCTEALSVMDYLISSECWHEHVTLSRLINIERIMSGHFNRIEFNDKIKVFDRCNFLVVASDQDKKFLTPYSGSWDFPGSDKLKIKYIGEWHEASKNFFKYTFDKQYASMI